MQMCTDATSVRDERRGYVRSGWLLTVALGIALSWGAEARAHDVERRRPGPRLVLPVGFHIGTISGRPGSLEPRNFTFGGELSAVYFDWRNWSWLGGFVSVDRLQQSAGTKVAFGPELGWWPLGFDLGPVWIKAAQTDGWGIQGRMHLTGVASSLYFGVAALGPQAVQSRDWEPLFEFGLLLKIPGLLWWRVPRLPRFHDRQPLFAGD